MALSIDPQDILDRAAFRLHLPTFASGEFVTDAQALMLLEDSSERLVAMLHRVFGSNYFAKSATTATQAGVDIVSLPVDLTLITGVYWIVADRELKLDHAAEVSSDILPRSWPSPSYWGSTQRVAVPSYRLEGEVLVLRPVPSEVYTLRVDYQSTPRITSLATSFLGQAGWREWMVLDVCSQVSDREQKDDAVARWESKKAKVEADLVAQASNRDRGAVYQPRDTRGVVSTSRSAWWWGRR